MNKELLKGHSQLIILAALAKQPMHGYVLSEYLKLEMPDSFKFGVGMLYPLLHTMEKKKLITGEWKDWVGVQRRVYTLTKQGKKDLETKKKEWLAFSSLVGQLVNEILWTRQTI